MRNFDEFVKKKFGDSIRPPPKATTKGPYPEDDTETGEPDEDHDVYKRYEGLYGEGTSTLPEVDDIPNYDLNGNKVRRQTTKG